LGYNAYIHGNVIMKLPVQQEQTKCLFSKTENRKVKQVLPGDWYPWENGGYKERGRRVNMVEIICTYV
jgi:hypothetical protein